MKKYFLLFFIFLFVFAHTQYSYSLSTNTELSETCLETNELSKISLSCFNNDAPLKSVGFYFGCSRMLQYSIVTKKDGSTEKVAPAQNEVVIVEGNTIHIPIQKKED